MRQENKLGRKRLILEKRIAAISISNSLCSCKNTLLFNFSFLAQGLRINFLNYRIQILYPSFFCILLLLAQILLIKKLFYLVMFAMAILLIDRANKKKIICFIILFLSCLDVSSRIKKFEAFAEHLSHCDKIHSTFSVSGEFRGDIKAKSSGVFTQNASIKFNGISKGFPINFIYPENIVWTEFPLACENKFYCTLHESDFSRPKDFHDHAHFASKNIISEINLRASLYRDDVNDITEPACVCINDKKQRVPSQSIAERVLLQAKTNDDQISKQYLYTVLAAVFGKGQYIPENIKNIFFKAGLLHLLVISGYHLAVLITIAVALSTLVTKKYVRLLYHASRKQIECMCGALVIVLICMNLEMNLPLWRAFIGYFITCVIIMKSFYMLRLRVLIQSLIAINILFPLAIFTASVQLTYSALLGLLFANFVVTQGFFYRLETGLVTRYLIYNTCAYFFTIPVQYLWFDTINFQSILYNVFFSVPFTLITVLFGSIISILIMFKPPFVDYLVYWISRMFEALLISLEIFEDYLS